MSAIYVEITATKGSAPRDAGTVMQVTATDIRGTIGGGALEHRAIETARQMLDRETPDISQTIALGPGLGQCCGGAVTLLFTRTPRALPAAPGIDIAQPPVTATRRPLWIWGAGHVGRALVAHAAPTEAFDITWVDTTRGRFPTPMPAGLTALPAQDMPRMMPYAPRDALHLILTYAHDIDLALCAAALSHGFGYCGLIGSATKWARFRKRLRALALDPRAITCPIGDPAQGKHPQQIAAGTIRYLLAHPAGDSTRLRAQVERRQA